MTQTVTLPNGDTIDFPDNMSPDDLNAAVSRHMAATSNGATSPDLTGNEPSIAARANVPPQPQGYDWFERNVRPAIESVPYVGPYLSSQVPRTDPQGNLTLPGPNEPVNFATSALMRANPLLAIPNAAFVGTQLGLNAASAKLGGPQKEVFNPLESTISGLDIGLSPNASPATKTASEVAPWLVPTGNQIGRVAEAPGVFNKLTTLGRSEAGNVVDWALSDEAQKWAAEHGMGPLAQMIAGMVGGNARQIAARTAAPPTRAVVGPQPDAGATFDVNKALLPPESAPGAPPPSDRGAATVPPFRDVASPDSSVARFVSGAGAIPFSGTGETGAVKAQTDAIARTADSALSTLDPGTTSVTQAGPASLKAEASTLASQARDKILTGEQRLMANSDAIDGQIGNTRTDASALRQAAEDLYTSPNVGPTVQNQAKKILDSINANTAPDGSVSYGALKNERSAFSQFIDGLYQAPTGDVTVKNTLARALQPIKDAMSQTMGAAADEAGAATGDPTLGARFRQNDADWTTHAAIKHQLADIGGTLNQGRTGFDPAPGGKKVASILSNSVEGGGQGMAPIINIEQGLGEQPARSAVAETVASMGTPKKAESDYAFQPSTFAKGVQNIDSPLMDYIEQKAGPQARQNLENAAEAGAATSQPPKQGGLRRTLGAIVGAAPFVAPAAAAFGHPGAVVSPVVSMLTSATQDPDFIRTVANRNVPLTSPELAAQMMTHAALGSRPNAVPAWDALRSGAGQAVNAAGSVVPALLRYLPGVRDQ